MIKLENTVTPNPEQWTTVIMGTRNPMNSWDKSDSGWKEDFEGDEYFTIGPEDLKLMTKLRNAGTDHRKFMRMITVYVDITAPLYWWKEFDTYAVGVVKNSCSTMHKIHDREFSRSDFSYDYLMDYDVVDRFPFPNDEGGMDDWYALAVLDLTVCALNEYRRKFLETKDKKYWWQMIQLLPSSYNQKRTVMMNYEVLANIYKSRKNHKLDCWRDFCKWIETLPYSEVITGDVEENT